jgi:hypothetical protein
MVKQPKRNIDTLQWRESRTVKRLDELRLGDEIKATLRWAGPFSKLAYARSRNGRWAFDRPRLLSRDVEIRDAKTPSSSQSAPHADTLVAVYHEKWTGEGTLEFVDGRAYDWAPTDFWQTRWAFFGTDDRPLVAFADTSGLFEQTAQVTLHHRGLSPADFELLVTLGRYLMVLKREDVTVATAASTAAIVT